MDPDREALRKKCEEILQSVEWALTPAITTGHGCDVPPRQRLGRMEIGVRAGLLCDLRELMLKKDAAMPEPDLAALRNAIDGRDQWARLAKEQEGGARDAYFVKGEFLDIVLAAARRDLARLEGEKPKRASLGELVEVLESCRGSGAREFLEAAAVLRSVGEFQQKMKNPATRAGFDDAIIFAWALYRNLPGP